MHDYWYDKKDATREQIKRADDDFVRCVKASPNYRVGDNVNKKLMTSVFEGKRKLEGMGLNPLRGTSSDGVEKKSEAKHMKKRHVAKRVKRRQLASETIQKILPWLPRPDRLKNIKWEGK